MSDFDDAVAERTIWGEARGEGATGMRAVAHVIRNRVKDGRWGSTPAAVCLAPMQFSCWNPHDPNRRQILELDETSFSFDMAQNAWWRVDDDITHGATHYRVIGTPASWADGLTPCAVIGHHEFFKDVR
jgi:spore germination cell wall hydrolase CwlJ-like protein